MMTLNDWLQHIENLHDVPMSHGNARVRAVAHKLDLLPVSYPVIAVGGTNGKGTTTALLCEILKHATYKVGTYTSPHIYKVNERICINQKMIDDDVLCAAFEIIDKARGRITLTYFEFLLLASLLIFRDQRVDIAIMEVGLGGRLDAVSIVNSEVAVITNVALDHMDVLGPNRDEIAKEKAGIIKKHRPVVFGEENVPNTILDKVLTSGAKLFSLRNNFSYKILDGGNSWKWICPYNCKKCEFKRRRLPLANIPLDNAAIALMVLCCLRDRFFYRAEDVIAALKDVNVAGRHQIIAGKCRIILDVAHNPAAASYLAGKLISNPVTGKTHAVFSAFKDKDLVHIVAPLMEVVDVWHYAPLPGRRAADKNLLKNTFQNVINGYNPNVQPQIIGYNSVGDAFDGAYKMAEAHDRIVVFGSFQTLANIKYPQK